ncbi:MAG: type II toxin-antitoxin system HicA family toxin [Actinomycetia bacterium]|nr:type II toxin-antitoxin system HicA family toxin [Actinomycetes bacterium]
MDKLLRKLGFEAVRHRGSHVFYRHPDGRTPTYPPKPPGERSGPSSGEGDSSRDRTRRRAVPRKPRVTLSAPYASVARLAGTALPRSRYVTVSAH